VTATWEGIPSDRVVAVVADLDTGLVQVGSGYLITERLALTALHCTVDRMTGREARSLSVIRRTDGAEASATRIAASLDLAVLSLPERPEWSAGGMLERPAFGRIGRDRAGEMHDCQAVGFPLWQMDPQAVQRNAAELHGTIRVTEDAESGFLVMRDALLSDVAVPSSASGERADMSPWGGLSGALVFLRGVALGVVIEHHPRQGRSAIRIMPVERVAALASVNADAAAVASALGLPPADELPLVDSWPQHSPNPTFGKVWRIPFPIDPDFVGRDQEMTALSATLAPGSRTVITQAISGLGGIGKTQLAAHVAHATANRFQIIWWIEAERRATIDASLRSLGKALRIGEDPSSEDVLAKLSSLDPSVNWILIYDNVDSPASLQRMLPTRGSGVVLITTRYQDWPAWASVINLGPLSEVTAVSLLSKGTKNEGDIASRIADMFGRLPLALAQAAAQIRAGMSLAQYEELLKSRFVDALGSQVSLPDYNRSVLDVIVLSCEAAASAAIGAQRLLLLLAILDADRIDDWLLQKIPKDDALADPLALSNALAALKRFSLVTEVQGESKAYAMHRLVQEVIRRTWEGEQADTTRLALHTLANAIGSLDWISDHLRTFRIVGHLRYFLDAAERYHARETVIVLRFLASRAEHALGNEGTALWAARTALRIVESNPDFSDDDLVAALLDVHHVESKSHHSRRKQDTTEIRRALALQRKKDEQGSLAEVNIELELARTLARNYYWWVEFDISEDDLAEARAITESVVSVLQREDKRAALVSARSLHAGIIGHLHRVDEAVAEYYDAIALAKADGSVWWGRTTAAHALYKFGRIADARKVIHPLLDRLDDDSEDAVMRSLHGETIDRIYSSCLWEQRDWREYVRYKETILDGSFRMGRRNRVAGSKIQEYYLLRSLRAGYEGLEHPRKVAELDKQIEETVIVNILQSLVPKGERVPGELPSADKIVAMLERYSANNSLPVGADWLYKVPMFADRPDLKVRIARANRISRERKAKEERPVGSYDASFSLVVYALMEEARELAVSDWNAAVSTFERGRSLITSGKASFSRSELAKACMDMVSEERPESSIFIQEAVELLTGEAGYDSKHHVDFSCTVPDQLMRAASLIAKVSRDFKTARSLEFAAATLEEKVHGRVFPSVSTHLFNAAWYSRRSKDEAAGPMRPASLLEESLEIAAVCFGDDSPRWAGRATELAVEIRDTHQPKAKLLLERSVTIFSNFYGPGHSSARECTDNLATLSDP